MQKNRIGNTDIYASIIGLGAWAVGGGPWWSGSDDELSLKAIETAIDNGINLIDTAPAYGFGHSERLVGKAISGRRDQVVLSTKCGLWWKDDRGSPAFVMEGISVRKSLDPETITVEIEDSLKRLGTDYIDIYHTHWQSIEPYKTPIEDTMACLLKLKDAGKIRCIAVSNADPACMDEYLKTGRIDANQPKYSMLTRGIEKDIIPYCVKNNISILAYSPLEQGLLTGKYTLDRKINESEYRNKIPWFKYENRIKVLTLLDKWAGYTAEYGCTLSQLVIAWTSAQPGITHLLCGGRKPDQVLENVKAADVRLSAEHIDSMRADVEALGEPA